MTEFTLDEYQRRALEFAEYPNSGRVAGLIYTALGLGDESGEVCGEAKRLLRDDRVNLLGDTDEEVNTERINKFLDENGDSLWYIALGCHELGITLGELAQMNLDKLTARKAAGTIRGEGSNR